MAETLNEESNVVPESPIRLNVAEGADKIEAQKVVVEALVNKFEKWSSWRQPYENLWSNCYAVFLSITRVQKLLTRAKVFVPVAFQVVEAALPKLVNIIFGAVPWFEVVPEKENDEAHKLAAKAQQKVIARQLELAKFFVKFVVWAKQLLMYGTSYFYVNWNVKREHVWEKIPQPRVNKTEGGIAYAENVLEFKKELVLKVVERTPKIEVLDIADVYPDPDARPDNDDEGEGVFVLSSMSLADLKASGQGKFPAFGNVELVQEHKRSDKGQQVKQDRRSIRGLSEKPVTMGDDVVEIITYWGKYDLDGDGVREECVIVIANRAVLLKAMRNPFEHLKRPVIRATLFPVPLEWFGIGLLEPIIPLISELNTLRNQALDVNNLIINRMWKVNALRDVDMDTLISSPNGVVLTDDMDAVEALDQPTLPTSVYTDQAVVQRDIENVTAPKSVQGMPESGQLGRTARGAQLIIGQALEKFGMAASLTEDGAIRQVLWFCKELNKQFLDNDVDVQEFYQQYLDFPVVPEMFFIPTKFKMVGLSETITKEAKINQMISFVTIFKDVPGVNLLGIGRAIWTLMDTGENAEKMITQGPFPQVLNQQLPPEAMNAIQQQVKANGVSGGVAVPGARSV